MKKKKSSGISVLFRLFNTLCFLTLTSCAYTFSGSARSLPDDVKTVALPQFKNKTMETGIEVYFTNAMRDRFSRYNVARVTDEKYADAIVKGTITTVTYTPGGKQTSTYEGKPEPSAAPFLPSGAVIAAEYRIWTETEVQLVRRTDGKVLWQGTFSGETNYSSPQVTMAGVNTVNPLYNLSARRANIQTLSQQLMEEAFNRMTENF